MRWHYKKNCRWHDKKNLSDGTTKKILQMARQKNLTDGTTKKLTDGTTKKSYRWQDKNNLTDARCIIKTLQFRISAYNATIQNSNATIQIILKRKSGTVPVKMGNGNHETVCLTLSIHHGTSPYLKLLYSL